MSRLLHSIIPVLALALGLCALPSSADACTCGNDPAPQVAMDSSDAVFVGTVSASRRLPLTDDSTTQLIEYSFEISHTYKGPTGRAVVRSKASVAACGRTFEEGVVYLVYARKTDEVLTDTQCSRTRPAADAIEDFKEIGYPTVDQPPAGQTIASNPTLGRPPLSRPTLVATSPHLDLITAQCQTVAEGELDAAQFAELVDYTGANGFLCTRSLVVNGTVELNQPNLRIVALDHGGLRIAGNLLISAGSVLMGAKVDGTVLLSERATGSVLVGNVFGGVVLAATSQFIGVGNTCSQTCQGPSGAMTLQAHVPNAATGIVRQVPRERISELSSDELGKLIGWHTPETPYRPKYEDKPELKEIDLGDLADEWPPPSSGADNGGAAWVPVYGREPTGSEPSIWGIYVPLEVGRFRQPELGFLYIP